MAMYARDSGTTISVIPALIKLLTGVGVTSKQLQCELGIKQSLQKNIPEPVLKILSCNACLSCETLVSQSLQPKKTSIVIQPLIPPPQQFLMFSLLLC